MSGVEGRNVQLASSETAREMNRDLILELIRKHQPVSRADLARISGLQRSTVSQIAELLIAENWIREGGIAKKARGRNPTMLGLNEQLAILCVDIQPGQATVAAIDLTGRFLTRSVVTFFSDPEKSLRQIGDELAELRSRLPQSQFQGVGVSVSGRMDPSTQILKFAPNLNWVGRNIKGVLEQKLGLKVELENSASASLLAELWSGHLQDEKDVLLISVGEGIEAAVLSDGKLIVSANGMASELGHMTLRGEGPVCTCGARGCWQVFASSAAAVREYKDLARTRANVTYMELLRRAEGGDEKASEALAHQARELGQGLRLAMAASLPEIIVLTGEVTHAWRRFEPLIKKVIANHPLSLGRPPKLVARGDGESLRLWGAAVTVLQRHSGYRKYQ